MPADPYIGQIISFAGNRATLSGFLPCNGQELQIRTNAALFALIGTRYGGDGRNTFRLPNLNGRTIVGAPAASPGVSGGAETVVLVPDNLPPHTHNFNGFASDANTGAVTNNLFASITLGSPPPPQPTTVPTPFGAPTNLVPLNPRMIRTSGGSMPHDNMQPFLVIKFFIAVQGLFPPRP